MNPPDPLTPADCDLRDFRNMPLDVQRFRDSDLVTEEDPEAVLAALFLWGSAWHQFPAASLPNDDRTLARFAGYGRSVRDWMEVREAALRGFVLCSDGRLYHPVLAEKANSAWDKRLQLQWTRAKDRHRKAEKELATDEKTPFPEFEQWKETREVPDHKPGRQPRLPLESDPHSGGTEPPSARTIGARDRRAHAPAHTDGDPNPEKANDSRKRSAGKAPTFQRKDPSIPAENALKGKVKEKVKIEEGNHIPIPDHIQGDGANFPEPDLVELHADVCQAAGYHPTGPAQIAASLDEVRSWKDRGLDFETVVLPAIRATVAASRPDDRTRTLGRFRHAIAREEAKAHEARSTGRAHKPTASPILEPAGEDPRFRPIRAALLKSLGNNAYTLALNDIRFEAEAVEFGEDAPPLRLVGAPFAVTRALDAHRDAILKAAQSAGFDRVW